MERTLEHNFARIEVQKCFCESCMPKIKQELQKIKDISNVGFCKEGPMVFFNFIRANELACALNTLTELGYPEIGEMPASNTYGAVNSCGC